MGVGELLHACALADARDRVDGEPEDQRSLHDVAVGERAGVDLEHLRGMEGGETCVSGISCLHAWATVRTRRGVPSMMSA